MNQVFREYIELFVLLIEDAHRTSYKQYILPTVKTTYYNVVIGAKNYFDQTVKNDMRTYMSFKKFQLVKEMIIQLVVF